MRPRSNDSAKMKAALLVWLLIMGAAVIFLANAMNHGGPPA